jgi:hypothetical protein
VVGDGTSLDSPRFDENLHDSTAASAAVGGLVSVRKKPPRITTEVVAGRRCCYRKGRHASRESNGGAVEEDDAGLSGKLRRDGGGTKQGHAGGSVADARPIRYMDLGHINNSE